MDQMEVGRLNIWVSDVAGARRPRENMVCEENFDYY
jgi:hypothetical protein